MTAPKELRATNVAAVLDALRRHGSLSRTQLVDVTGLSRTTVISIVEELAHDRRVAINGARSQQAPGRPAAEISLGPGAGVVLGIAVDRAALDLVLTDLSGARLVQRTAASEGPRADADAVLAIADDALRTVGVPRSSLVSAGIAASPTAGRSIRRSLAAHLGVPVTVEHPARLEALAECTLGAGRTMQHLIYVGVGESIAGAVMVDGRLRPGPSSPHASIEHVPVGADGPECSCGRRGCLSSIASGEAVLRALSPLHGHDLDLDGLLGLARSGDAPARRAIADAGQAVGAALTTLCTALNPEAVILGGALAATDLPLFKAVGEHLATPKLQDNGPIALHPATLGRDAPALGAAAAAARAVQPRPQSSTLS